MWSQYNIIGFRAGGGGDVGMSPRLLAQGGQREAHHFELQPLVCSGKVIPLTQHIHSSALPRLPK